MFANLLRGAAAGAAGTTALNAVTYLDMALRARPASDTPERAVDEIARRAGHPIPGAEEEHRNRLQGLGPLSGPPYRAGVTWTTDRSRCLRPVGGTARPRSI